MLKRGAHRSVFRSDRQADGAARLVKCFRARGLIRRLFDGQRARREARVLARLHAAGLPVPAPLAVRRSPRGWELWCEWIPDAVTLAQVIEGGARWPRPPRELAPELGRLLARAHRTGLAHPDLHPGNVLVDARGTLWLVDFTKARFTRRPRLAVAEGELVRLEAAVREQLPFSLRARCLRGWLEERGPLPAAERDALAARLAARARIEQRELLWRERDRWLRTSSRCVREAALLIVRRGAAALGSAERAALLEDSAHEVPRSDCWRNTLVRTGPSARADWLELGRAADHHLPTTLPLALALGARPRALFELPEGARPVERPGVASAHSAGQLCGALLDRGLILDGDPRAALFVTHDGGLLLGPGTRLVPFDEDPSERAIAPLRELFDARAGERAASFERGLRAALRRAPTARRQAPCSAMAGFTPAPPWPSAASSGSASSGRPPQPPPMAL